MKNNTKIRFLFVFLVHLVICP